jgi:hypothetical protein
MSFFLYLVYGVLLIRNQQFCERGDSGYAVEIKVLTLFKPTTIS